MIDAAAVFAEAVARSGVDLSPPTPNLPADFWEARPVLDHIRQGAHARGRSADAVFGALLARVSAGTPPSLVLPAIVGSVATLDLLVAVVGASGAGKSSAAGVAAELLALGDEVAVVPIGSGEGLVDAFLGSVVEVAPDGSKHRVRRQVQQAVLGEMDEGQALHEIGGRKGATLLPTLRSAWSGARLGQQNADPERSRNLPPRGYRFALLAGFQPEHAAPLLADLSGTAQRLLWFAAEDPNVPDRAPKWPGPVKWRPPIHGAGAMNVAAEVAEEIRSGALARTRGEIAIASIDAHRDLLRLKVAALLGVLDRRPSVSVQDWSLSGMVLDASDKVRASIDAHAREAAREAERSYTAKLVHRNNAVAVSAEARALAGMARAIARHVHRGGCEGGCRRRCATLATKSAHRALATIDEALDDAEGRGWIVRVGDALKPGEECP